MKLFSSAILLVISMQVFSQSKYEHFDSIVNNTMPEHSCQYFDEDCFFEIKKAKESIKESGMPFYVYQKNMHMIGGELFPYQNEIEEICAKLKITILDKLVYCIVDDSSPMHYCYNRYLTRNLKERRGKNILDSIHIKALRLHLKRYPEKPFNVPEQLLPFEFNKYHQEPYCKSFNPKKRDTLYLPPGISYSEKSFIYKGKTIQPKESFWVKVLVNTKDSIEKISIISRTKIDDTTLNGNILKIKVLLREAFLQRYPKWESATFLGEKVNEEVNVTFTLIQHNTKLD